VVAAFIASMSYAQSNTPQFQYPHGSIPIVSGELRDTHRPPQSPRESEVHVP
jgi:hypothetical protein